MFQEKFERLKKKRKFLSSETHAKADLTVLSKDKSECTIIISLIYIKEQEKKSWILDSFNIQDKAFYYKRQRLKAVNYCY